MRFAAAVAAIASGPYIGAMQQRPVPDRSMNLTQLASLAGVSIGTVSKALSGTGTISKATRDRICALAAEHDFRLNQTARGLKMGRTGAIAVVIPLGHDSAQTISDPFFITLIGHIADHLSDRGYALVLSKLVPDGPGWLSAVVRSGRSDGVIVIGQSNQQAELAAVAGRYAPLVVWGQTGDDDGDCMIVGSDNRLGGRLATEHLLARGRRRIGFVGMTDIPEVAARHAGYREALDAAGLAPGPLIQAPLTAHEAFDSVHAALTGERSFDALVCASDVTAMSAMRAMTERGWRVPGDVAVTGYDDVILAGYTTPPLTTVRQDLARAGALLVDHVLRRIDGETTTSVTLPPALIVRAST